MRSTLYSASLEPAVWVGMNATIMKVTLDAYTLVNLSGSFEVDTGLELFARVNNLLDEDYEEAGGYGTEGRSAFIGMKAEIN